MHSMHKTVFEIKNPRCVLISVGYIDKILKDQLLWEQEVGGSNPLAPTSLRFWTEWKTKAAASKPKSKTGHYHGALPKLRLGAPIHPNVIKRLAGMKFYYTYILQTQKSPDRFYIGFTENLESRLKSHNRGENPHTSKYRPWRIKTAIAFSDRQRAIDFEEYLKTPSGRAFSKKRLWSPLQAFQVPYRYPTPLQKVPSIL